MALSFLFKKFFYDEPRIEASNLHPLYDGLRENDFNEYYKKWKDGFTGFLSSMRVLDI